MKNRFTLSGVQDIDANVGDKLTLQKTSIGNFCVKLPEGVFHIAGDRTRQPNTEAMTLPCAKALPSILVATVIGEGYTGKRRRREVVVSLDGMDEVLSTMKAPQ